MMQCHGFFDNSEENMQQPLKVLGPPFEVQRSYSLMVERSLRNNGSIPILAKCFLNL